MIKFTAKLTKDSRLLVLALLLGFTVIRLILAVTWPAGIDESYVIAVSRQWSLSYFDHPPLTFWISRSIWELFGSNNIALVRLPFVLMGTASALLIYRLTEKAYGTTAGLWALAWFSIAPFFLLSAGHFVVPDGPLNLALLITISLLLPGLLNPSNPIPIGRTMVAGLVYAVALASKYQALALVLSLAGFHFANRHARERLIGNMPRTGSRKRALIFLVCSLLGLLPVVTWNSQHDWISFGFQAGRGVSEGLSIQPLNFVKTLGGQLAYLLPITWLVIIVAALKGIIKPNNRADSLFGWLTAVQPICFLGISLISHNSLPHWSMSGFLFGFPLMGAWTAEQLQSREKLITRTWLALAAVMCSAAIAVGMQFNTALFTRWWASPTLALDSNWQLLDWTTLLAVKKELTHPTCVVTRSWQVGAKVGYILGNNVSILPLTDPRHFQFIPRRHPCQMLAIEPAIPGKIKSTTENFLQLLAEKGFQASGPMQRITQANAGYPRIELLIIPVHQQHAT